MLVPESAFWALQFMFQRFINSIFRDLAKEGVAFHIIPAKHIEANIKRLKIILKIASEYGLEINTKKCQFLQRRVEYLGHSIKKYTIQPSIVKKLAVKYFQELKTLKQVQSFLGFTGYFRKYISNYSRMKNIISSVQRISKI